MTTELLLLTEGEPADTRRRLPHVAKTLDEMTWAVTAPMLATIQEIYARRMAGERFSELELDERLATAAHRGVNAIDVQTIEYHIAGGRGSSGGRTGQIAVLPLYGVMMPRAGLFAQMSGGCSVEQFTAAFNAAMNDPSVSAILIDVDSPGGSTGLVPELGQAIYDARGEKPIAAIANTDAGSGAYWVASQCDELAVTPSGMVGSIGCYGTHQDLSAALEKIGVKTTIISYGKYKTELAPTQPLTPEAKQAVQSVVDEFGTMFEAAVARGRGVTQARVADGFGQGRMVTAKNAVSAGMADRTATFDQMVTRLARGQVKAGKPTRGATATMIGGGFRTVEIAATPDDDEPMSGTCASCPHDAEMHDGDQNDGPCTTAGCSCDGFDDTDAADDTEAAASADPLAALLTGASSHTITTEGRDLIVLELKGEITDTEAQKLGDRIAALAPGRQVVVVTGGSTLTAGPQPDAATPAEEPAALDAAAQEPDAVRSHLHRRAVRAALRQTASAVETEEG